MKILYYHYVRPAPDGLPHFRYLHLEDFKTQLDYLDHEFGFVAREDFLKAVENGGSFPDGVVLTFDDGFTDHVDYVFPELERRGIWGMFFIPTGVYGAGEMLDVHRVHSLLGAHGGAAMLKALREKIEPEMLANEHREEFRAKTYTDQDNDAATDEFKRILNYFMDGAARKSVLDGMMADFCNEKAVAEKLYMSRKDIARLQNAGMIVGSHSVTHPVFSNIGAEEQRREVADSFAFLDDVTGGLDLRTFCYPYGHTHTYTPETVAILADNNCQMAFTTGNVDATAQDFAMRPLEVPRYDCNRFPHGQASYGPSRPEADGAGRGVS